MSTRQERGQAAQGHGATEVIQSAVPTVVATSTPAENGEIKSGEELLGSDYSVNFIRKLRAGMRASKRALKEADAFS